MEEIKIRRASLEDAEMLSELSRKTFWDAFHANPKNAPEDMAEYMRTAFSAKQIKQELADAKAVFLVAEIAGDAVGYAKLLIDAREPGIEAEKPIELARLYSKHEFLGKGVGAKLMERCFREAKNLDRDAMWLGVWEFNPRAQAFYRKYGFCEVGEHIFLLGSDAQTDVLMQREIK